MNKSIIVVCALLFLVPASASAHQPRIVDDAAVTIVEHPEISKAYYGHLTGEPHVFEITSAAPFPFYMNILVPAIPGAKQDVSAAVADITQPTVPIAVLEGFGGPWTPMHEPFGQDDYFQGPEFRSVLPAGTYRVIVWSSNNDSAYSLAIGEAESFSVGDILDAYRTMPLIKSSIFHKPSYTAYFTPFLGVPILTVIAALAGIAFVIARRRRRQ